MNKTFENDKNLWVYYKKDQPEVFSLTHDRHKKIFHQVTKYIKPGSKILELGFGDGCLLEMMKKRYECYGIDIDSQIIEDVKEKTSGIKFGLVDEQGKFPFEDSYFDGFVASEVLEHMTDDEIVKCLSEIKRVLKHEGYSFVTFPAEENLRENECYCPNCSHKFHKWGHKQSWDINKIRGVFSRFKIIKISEYFTRFEGKNVVEKIIGYVFYYCRRFINMFQKLPNRSFMVIFKKI